MSAVLKVESTLFAIDGDIWHQVKIKLPRSIFSSSCWLSTNIKFCWCTDKCLKHNRWVRKCSQMDVFVCEHYLHQKIIKGTPVRDCLRILCSLGKNAAAFEGKVEVENWIGRQKFRYVIHIMDDVNCKKQLEMKELAFNKE